MLQAFELIGCVALRRFGIGACALTTLPVWCAPRADIRGSVLYELVVALLQSLSSQSVPLPIASFMAGLVMLAIVRLREDLGVAAAAVSSAATRPAIVSRGVGGAAGVSVVVARLPVEHCHALLRGLVLCLMRPGTSQSVRGHLCGALLNYIQLRTGRRVCFLWLLVH